ncbi:MAG: hypothetical protein RH862_10695 [Leptospiraceae bacterium]
MIDILQTLRRRLSIDPELCRKQYNGKQDIAKQTAAEVKLALLFSF